MRKTLASLLPVLAVGVLVTACSATTKPASVPSGPTAEASTSASGPTARAVAVLACQDRAQSRKPGSGGVVMDNRGLAEAQQAMRLDPEYTNLATDWNTTRQARSAVATANSAASAIGAQQAAFAEQAVDSDCRGIGVPIPSVAATTVVPVSAAPTPAAPKPIHVITGSLVLVANRNTNYPSNCRGLSQDGQGDIQVGAAVTVRSGAGQILGVGSLTGCQFTDISQPGQSLSLTFSLRVDGVADSDFYTIEVANRGQVPFSRSQLVANGWRAALSL